MWAKTTEARSRTKTTTQFNLLIYAQEPFMSCCGFRHSQLFPPTSTYTSLELFASKVQKVGCEVIFHWGRLTGLLYFKHHYYFKINHEIDGKIEKFTWSHAIAIVHCSRKKGATQGIWPGHLLGSKGEKGIRKVLHQYHRYKVHTY